MADSLVSLFLRAKPDSRSARVGVEDCSRWVGVVARTASVRRVIEAYLPPVNTFETKVDRPRQGTAWRLAMALVGGVRLDTLLHTTSDICKRHGHDACLQLLFTIELDRPFNHLIVWDMHSILLRDDIAMFRVLFQSSKAGLRENFNLFYHTLQKGPPNLALSLLDWGVDPFYPDGEPLKIACFFAKSPVARRLLRLGPYGPGKLLDEVLYYVCMERCTDSDLVEDLIAYGANVQKLPSGALVGPCGKGFVMVVHALLRAGMNPNMEHPTPLYLACRDGQYEMAKLLLKYGADISANHDRALKIAIERGHQDIVTLLKDTIVERARLTE